MIRELPKWPWDCLDHQRNHRAPPILFMGEILQHQWSSAQVKLSDAPLLATSSPWSSHGVAIIQVLFALQRQGTFSAKWVYSRGVRSESLEVFIVINCIASYVWSKYTIPWRVGDLLPLESLLYRMQLLFLWKLIFAKKKKQTVKAAVKQIAASWGACAWQPAWFEWLDFSLFEIHHLSLPQKIISIRFPKKDPPIKKMGELNPGRSRYQQQKY